jgi:SAM-dependent methyltransferase
MRIVRGSDSDSAYWTDATDSFRRDDGPRTWRRYCDSLNRQLVEEWTGTSPPRSVLKTDLFDEAVGAGLLPGMRGGRAELHGIDVSPGVARAVAREQPGIRATCADVRHLPLRDCSFDLIVSNSTLDHFGERSDIRTALDELHRVGSVGGLLVITMDNLDNPVIRLRSRLPFALLRRLGIVPYFVGVTLTGHELEAELEQAGFRVERTATMMHAPRIVFLWACRLADRFGTERVRSFVLGILTALERLGRVRTRRRTAYYTAALARRSARSRSVGS